MIIIGVDRDTSLANRFRLTQSKHDMEINSMCLSKTGSFTCNPNNCKTTISKKNLVMFTQISDPSVASLVFGGS